MILLYAGRGEASGKQKGYSYCSKFHNMYVLNNVFKKLFDDCGGLEFRIYEFYSPINYVNCDVDTSVHRVDIVLVDWN